MFSLTLQLQQFFSPLATLLTILASIICFSLSLSLSLSLHILILYDHFRITLSLYYSHIIILNFHYIIYQFPPPPPPFFSLLVKKL